MRRRSISGTLTSAGNPHLVIANVQVDSGDSLFVEEGVEFHFSLGTRFDVDHAGFRIEGQNPVKPGHVHGAGAIGQAGIAVAPAHADGGAGFLGGDGAEGGGTLGPFGSLPTLTSSAPGGARSSRSRTESRS